MTKLRVATTQFELRSESSTEEYLAHMDGLVAEAANNGADVVLFPELASTGLLGSITDHEVTAATVSSDYWNYLPGLTNEIADGIRQMALAHGIAVLGGSHNRLAEDGSLRNTAYLAHPDGRVELQDKIHFTPQEHALGMTGGDKLLVTRIGPYTAGVLICADIQFPELSRYLVDQGVDLLLCPSLTWNRRGVHRVKTGCQARAIENQLYVVMSPLVGSSGLPTDAPMHAVGKAVACTPVDKIVGLNDGILAVGESDGEQLLVVDLDREVLLASRAKPEAPGLALRRPDFYEQLRAGNKA
ncbi:nitrilase-related carbon-nitrogen hydrolase [Paenarthrobacter sp. NPDC058040]|uniref:nitrilase-related carbon-nitrogen hydrolase n=1 Tax=unclassified Paenarthrobacter TaxID=2634190 RepID=UPI0036DE82EA